jgi:methylglyoxal synthase
MPRVALIAHDEEKPEMVELVEEYADRLRECELLATGTTGRRVREETGLDVERKESGRLGGDVQIAAEVAGGTVDAVVFLRDPLTAQPHEPDISALLRICDVTDTALATNRASATSLLDAL